MSFSREMAARGAGYDCRGKSPGLNSAMNAATDPEALKKIIKAALIEVFDERQDLIRNAVAEAIEDIAMVRAIEEGLGSEPATEEEVLALLRRTG
jgi:hypothetical protein